MKKVLICLLISVLASPRTWADPSPDQEHIESIKKKVAKCVDQQKRVVVETYDSRRLQGFISEAGPDDFVLSHAGRTTTLSYRDVRRISWPSPVWKQVKVMAGAAAIVGVIVGLVALAGGFRG
jgi:hypothetical protein